MKRIIYSAAVVLALGVVSCSKQDIRPVGSTEKVPVWRGSTTGNSDVDPNVGGKITDPNNDPESSSPVGDDN